MKNIILLSALCAVVTHAADQTADPTISRPVAIVTLWRYIHPSPSKSMRHLMLNDRIDQGEEKVTIPLKNTTTYTDVANIISSQKQVLGNLAIPDDINPRNTILQDGITGPIKLDFLIDRDAQRNDTYTTE